MALINLVLDWMHFNINSSVLFHYAFKKIGKTVNKIVTGIKKMIDYLRSIVDLFNQKSKPLISHAI